MQVTVNNAAAAARRASLVAILQVPSCFLVLSSIFRCLLQCPQFTGCYHHKFIVMWCHRQNHKQGVE